MTTIQNAIGGKLVTSVSTRTQPVFNPATGEAIATLPLSTNDEIDAAVAAATGAVAGDARAASARDDDSDRRNLDDTGKET